MKKLVAMVGILGMQLVLMGCDPSVTARGERGAPGADGARGPAGLPGPAGAPGAPGADGHLAPMFVVHTIGTVDPGEVGSAVADCGPSSRAVSGGCQWGKTTPSVVTPWQSMPVTDDAGEPYAWHCTGTVDPKGVGDEVEAIAVCVPVTMGQAKPVAPHAL